MKRFPLLLAALSLALGLLARLAIPSKLLFMVPSDIKTVAQLKGKKIGVSQFGDSSYVGAQLGLRRMGLNTKDVTYIAVGSSTNRAAALMNGAIQGGVVSKILDDSFVRRAAQDLKIKG